MNLVGFFQRLINELPLIKALFRMDLSCRHYPLVTFENGLEKCAEDESRDDMELYIRNKLKNGIQAKYISETIQKNPLQRSLKVF